MEVEAPPPSVERHQYFMCQLKPGSRITATMLRETTSADSVYSVPLASSTAFCLYFLPDRRKQLRTLEALVQREFEEEDDENEMPTARESPFVFYPDNLRFKALSPGDNEDFNLFFDHRSPQFAPPHYKPRENLSSASKPRQESRGTLRRFICVERVQGTITPEMLQAATGADVVYSLKRDNTTSVVYCLVYSLGEEFIVVADRVDLLEMRMGGGLACFVPVTTNGQKVKACLDGKERECEYFKELFDESFRLRPNVVVCEKPGRRASTEELIGDVPPAGDDNAILRRAQVAEAFVRKFVVEFKGGVQTFVGKGDKNERGKILEIKLIDNKDLFKDVSNPMKFEAVENSVGVIESALNTVDVKLQVLVHESNAVLKKQESAVKIERLEEKLKDTKEELGKFKGHIKDVYNRLFAKDDGFLKEFGINLKQTIGNSPETAKQLMELKKQLSAFQARSSRLEELERRVFICERLLFHKCRITFTEIDTAVQAFRRDEEQVVRKNGVLHLRPIGSDDKGRPIPGVPFF